jgi:hypothetical protein
VSRRGDPARRMATRMWHPHTCGVNPGHAAVGQVAGRPVSMTDSRFASTGQTSWRWSPRSVAEPQTPPSDRTLWHADLSSSP